MAEVLGAVSKLTSGMEKMLDRIGAWETRFDGSRRVTMSRGGGKTDDTVSWAIAQYSNLVVIAPCKSLKGA